METPDKVKTQIAQDAEFSRIFNKYLEVDKENQNAEYMAWATLATSVGVSLLNMLISIRKPESGRSLRTIQDLAFELNYNDFWARNSSFLMPLVIASINAQKDFVSLHSQIGTLQDLPLVDKAIASSECVGLEIFPLLLYLVGGPSLMVKYSVPIKLDLLPYLAG